MEQTIALKLEPELINKIDEYRRDVAREDYIRLCIVSMFANGEKKPASPHPNGSLDAAKPAPDLVTKEDFEQFKTEIEKYHFELASLLTRFCQEHVGELDAASGPHFYEQFIKLLQS